MSAPPPRGVSNRAFAELDGCDEARVRRGRRRGELAVLADGSLDPALAGSAWRSRAARPDGGDAAPAAGTLADAQRQREIAIATLRQRELAAREGEYVLRATAVRAERASAARIRRAVRTIPAIAAPRVVGRTLPGIQAALQTVIYDVLNGLCRQPEGKPRAATATNVPEIAENTTRLEAERLKVIATAGLHRLDLDISAGVVIRIRDGAAAHGHRCARLRTRLIAMLGNLPPHLARHDVKAARRVIAAAIEEALEELD